MMTQFVAQPNLHRNWLRCGVARPLLFPLRTRLLMLLFLLPSLLAACANPEMQAQLEQFLLANQRTASENGSAVAQEVATGNRLLVQGVDGNLLTMRPDGSERRLLTNDASSLRQYLQPTWSPNGAEVAYSQVVAQAGTLRSALIVKSISGEMRQEIEIPFAPFYIHWSPDGNRLAYLSNWITLDQPSIALRLVDFETGEPVRTLAEGQPLYFTWSPDSSRMLAHISNERLEFRTIEGAEEALSSTAAIFPAPQWSADGSQLLYALGDPTGQRLVLTDAEGNLIQEITDYNESISFELNPAGSHVAYVPSPSGAGTAAFGPLYLVDLATSQTRELTSNPVMAFFWSPDGSKLAYAAIDESASTLQLRWYVWDGTRSQPYAAFVPTQTFLQSYLIFFDQYARSMTLWAPDSSAFVYAAFNTDTGNNIWVQPLDAEMPTEVGRGIFATWSPQ